MNDPRPDTWMPLYVADYIADTTDLTTEQHGAYLLLIMHYWRRGPLSDDNRTLANVSRLTPKRWKMVRPFVAPFFQIKKGVWHHVRIDQELLEAAKNMEKKRSAGKAGASARWSGRNASANAGAKPAPMANGSQADTPLPSPSPLPNPVTGVEKIGTPLNETAFAGFIQRCGLPAAYVAKELNAIYDEFGERAFWDSFEKLKTLEARRPLGFLRKLASGHKEAAA